MLRIVSALIPIVILLSQLSLLVNAKSVEIDGYATESPWQDLEPQVLVSGEGKSNCEVTFALVTCFVDELSNSIYLAVKACTSGTQLTPQTSHGVMVNVDNSGFVEITHAKITEYDNFNFAFEGAVSEYNPNDFCAEIRVGIKYGLEKLNSIELRILDGNGVSSNVYQVDLSLLHAEETTTAPIGLQEETTAKSATEKYTTGISETDEVTGTKYNYTTPDRSKRTTERTTEKEKTTREKTTRFVTAAKTKEPKKTATQAAPVQIVTVYITEQTVTNLASENEKVSSGETVTVSQDRFSEYKELKLAGIIALIVLIFGVIVMVKTQNGRRELERANENKTK